MTTISTAHVAIAPAPTVHRRSQQELDAQARAVTERLGAIEDLFRVTEHAAQQAASLPDLLQSLTLIQQQVHATRKATINEARVTGHDDLELAALLRLNIADFDSRYPRHRKSDAHDTD